MKFMFSTKYKLIDLTIICVIVHVHVRAYISFIVAYSLSDQTVLGRCKGACYQRGLIVRATTSTCKTVGTCKLSVILQYIEVL